LPFGEYIENSLTELQSWKRGKKRQNMLDLNHNGIPDYQEPKVWLWLGSFVSRIIKMLAAQHTIAYKTAVQYDAVVAAYNAALDDADKGK
jgi:hypothetical protein